MTFSQFSLMFFLAVTVSQTYLVFDDIHRVFKRFYLFIFRERGREGGKRGKEILM